MNQTNGGSERVEVFADILGNNPEKVDNKYQILNGEDTPGSLVVGFGPGMTIPVKDGIEVGAKERKQILENQKNRKTEKQLEKQNHR